ncbi:Haloalkane dehalogenase [Cesiribacter andamanensis AMV16]|uniref:Haloalkane dehalogenase n=1 Tax=Cesiribacter andamanensis AMV16 TaxID=1279009 RepID=M7N4F8_9BACT|nr:Haloalkane dehalogenase [Cesiribacter andamanensis AMV16]
MLISDTPYPLPTRYLTTKAGLPLAYTDVGQGPPLLFIHGLGSYLPAWQKNIAFLSPHFRCLALDLPGFGKSGKEGVTPAWPFMPI